MITYEIAHRMLSKRGLVPNVTTPDRCESVELFELLREYREHYERMVAISATIRKKGTRELIAFTDYPFIELGDLPLTNAPMRQVRVLSYDGNKYCMIEVEGVTASVKAGYLYPSADAIHATLSLDQLTEVLE